LVQRVDLLERRLDAVETAQAKAPAIAAPPVAMPIADVVPPPAVDVKATKSGPVLRVDLGKAGVAIDGKTVADDALDATLEAQAARGDLSGVILSADDDVAYNDVIALMDRLKASGLDRVAIAARGGARPPE